MSFLICVIILVVAYKALGQAPVEKPYILRNANGMEAHILSYGAVVQKLMVPDRAGSLRDVILGFDSTAPYEDGTSPYFGALVGRVANRLADASFKLDGHTYHVTANENTTSLHGGVHGFSRHFWKERASADGTSSAIELEYSSPDGDEGYPGNLLASVTYLLTPDNELHITMQATTDADTPVNLAQHSYFNLNGVETSSTILNHEAHVNASYVTPVDHWLIPTGAFQPVVNTPYNLNTPTQLSTTVEKVEGSPPGYDINYVLFGLDGKQAASLMHDGKIWDRPRHAVTVTSPRTGISLAVDTTSPGLQFYTGNMLSSEDPVPGKGGVHYPQYGGFAVETQNFPNAINTPNFPDSVLKPERTYTNVCVWRFKTVPGGGALPQSARLTRLLLGLGLVLLLAAGFGSCRQLQQNNTRRAWHVPSWSR